MNKAFILALCLFAVAATASAEVVYVQPIQITSTDGSIVANAGRETYEAVGDKIWAQAGIDLIFNPWTVVNNTSLLDISGAEFNTLNGNPGLFGGSTDGMTINVWFAKTLEDALPGTLYGGAFRPSTSVFVNWDAVSAFNGGIGRLDTIAHEIGHALGLPHISGADNLMATGGSRNVPSSINDIFPSGPGYDQLTASQIATVLSSNSVKPDPVPEPISLALLMAGLAGVGIARRRRAA